jgi:putative transposase
MSRAGNGYENAAIEPFWSTPRTDTGLATAIPASRRHTVLAVFDDIETFYEPVRRHRSLGNVSPRVFEKQPT